MTLQTPAPTTDLLAQVRAARAARDAAEVRLIELALAWAHAHTVDPATVPASGYDPTAPLGVQADPDLDPEAIEWHGLPPLRWDAPASFAAANRISTTAGKAMLRDALVLHHRLPQVWARVVAGQVSVFRARRIAQAVLGQADDVTAYVDREVVDRAHSIGLVTLDRVLDEAMLRLHAEEREIEQLEALDHRYARLDEQSINHTGIATYEIRADLMDLTAFDEAVARIADALRRDDTIGSQKSHDVRRSMAVGILADPARALALLDNTPAPSPKRRIVLTYHLTDGGLLGVDPVGTDTDGRPLLDQLVRQWCGRDDIKITVQPVLRVNECHTDDRETGSYRPTTADLAEVQLRDRHCAFPYCTRSARDCDCDHVVPFKPDGSGGPTCPCNLAPLCRHHHRLKTHAGWAYTALEPGTYLWSDRYGQRFLRDADGTHAVELGAVDVGEAVVPGPDRPCSPDMVGPHSPAT